MTILAHHDHALTARTRQQSNQFATVIAFRHDDQVHPRSSESDILIQAMDTSNAYVKDRADLQNRQGKTRLSKWYAPYDDDEKVCDADNPF